MASPTFEDPNRHAPGDGPPAPFHVDVEPERDVVRVSPVGEVDLATIDEVRARIEELKAAGFRRVLLDLRGVTFLDSSGVRLVLEADASARADGWDFALVEGSATVQRVFALAGVRDRLRFAATAS